MPLAELQERFAAAVMDPSLRPPAEVVGRDSLPPGRRFNVYRNNVVVGLVNALRAAYPALERIVGAEFFAAMASVYVRNHLPERPILIKYGESFPDFIETFPPATQVPYLADVARLERARLAAYHAADAPQLDSARLAGIAPQELPATRFRFHPAAQIVRSRFPIVSIWSMNSGVPDPAPVDLSQAEDALVTRSDLTVEVRLLRPGAATFLMALQGGEDFATAVELATDSASDFDLTNALADCLAAGVFADLELGQDD